MPGMTAQLSGTDDIGRLHEEWSVLHARLRTAEQQLSDALRVYARGEAARPDDLMEDVEHMRAECAVRFRRLMDAIRAQPATPAA
jgi:hypothetical protein